MHKEIGLLNDRSNTTQQWAPTDEQAIYSAINNGSPNYSPTEIQYTFNSLGFRSNEFTEPAETRILFMGCSFTEGIGMHDSDCWPSLILKKVKTLPQFKDKNIPKLSIAFGGSGIDTESRLLHKYASIVQPTHIFYLFFNHYRREFTFNGITRMWGPNFSNCCPDSWSQVFTDEDYATAQTNRGLMLIDAIAAKHNIQAHIISFERDTVDIVKKLTEDYTSITTHGIVLPKVYNPSFLPDQWARCATLPLKARDNLHPGALWQYEVAAAVWDNIKHLFPPLPRKEFVQNVAVTKY